MGSWNPQFLSYLAILLYHHCNYSNWPLKHSWYFHIIWTSTKKYRNFKQKNLNILTDLQNEFSLNFCMFKYFTLIIRNCTIINELIHFIGLQLLIFIRNKFFHLYANFLLRQLQMELVVNCNFYSFFWLKMRNWSMQAITVILM